MAKTTDSTAFEIDKYHFTKWKVDPDTLLKLRVHSEIDKLGIFCDRIQYNMECKATSIKAHEILILSTSKESLDDIDLALSKKLKKKQIIDKFTFQDLIEKLLENKFKTWKILDEYQVKRINELLIKNNNSLDISYDKLKASICIIGSITPNTIKTMASDELLVRFGLEREEALQLKKIVGNEFYVTYGQLIEEAKNLQNLISQLTKYKYIFVANFHNLMLGEEEFLEKIGIGKHITVMADNLTKAKPKLFEKNWCNITKRYKPLNYYELKLENNVNVNNEKKYNSTIKTDLRSTSKNENAIELINHILNNKMHFTNFEELVKVLMGVLNNKRIDFTFLQFMSMIPGFDDTFLKQFCKLVSSENSNVYDFLIKYKDSLSKKTRSKLLPILNYLTDIENKLDKTSSNSVMMHLLHLCKISGIETQATKEMKEQFVELHHWLKFLEEHEDFKTSDDLIKCYMKNSLSKAKYTNTKAKYNVDRRMNTTVNIKLPISITVEKPAVLKTKSNTQAKVEDIPLRRSGSVKYSPRPRSWHAGTIFNAARKLR